MRQHNVTGAWSNSNIINAYAESISYDANGNILKYLRRGANTAGNSLNMDSLSYKYNWGADGKLLNNQLNYVKDTVSASNYTVDIDNQSANNYTYDHIGNLKKDVAEGIDTIRWTVYGKINRIVKNSNSLRINYGYDPGGNRTSKVVSGSADTTTFYVRDAQGNVLAIYTKRGTDAIKWNEQDLYGSSRIGLWRWDTIVPAAPPIAQTGSPIQDSLMIGARNYELTNHLGNVLSTISDKKIGHDSSGVVNYYIAEVLSQNDYYPFGMLMPGRKYEATTSYRYGFNGKENDNEAKGEGNQQDYGMRIYDPRLGKFLSVDPLIRKYPELTPYQFASNTPIQAIDLDGLESYLQIEGNRVKQQARMQIDAAKFEAKRTTQVQFTVHSQPPPIHSSPQATATMQSVDMSYDAVQTREEQRNQYEQAKGMSGATMDRLAAGPTYQGLTTAKAYVQGTLQHGYGIYEGIKEKEFGNAAINAGLFALDISPFIKLPGGSQATSFSVKSSGGGAVGDMLLVRKIAKGEKVDDIINEAKGLTWQSGNEHALVTLANGDRALVSGGPGGIRFKENEIQTLFGHTHPTSAPPSSADAEALKTLGQSKQYVLHGGEVTLVRPKN